MKPYPNQYVSLRAKEYAHINLFFDGARIHDVITRPDLSGRYPNVAPPGLYLNCCWFLTK
jgi:hypothetical protein